MGEFIGERIGTSSEVPNCRSPAKVQGKGIRKYTIKIKFVFKLPASPIPGMMVPSGLRNSSMAPR